MSFNNGFTTSNAEKIYMQKTDLRPKTPSRPKRELPSEGGLLHRNQGKYGKAVHPGKNQVLGEARTGCGFSNAGRVQHDTSVCD